MNTLPEIETALAQIAAQIADAHNAESLTPDKVGFISLALGTSLSQAGDGSGWQVYRHYAVTLGVGSGQADTLEKAVALAKENCDPVKRLDAAIARLTKDRDAAKAQQKDR
jgi:hypothetical protein